MIQVREVDAQVCSLWWKEQGPVTPEETRRSLSRKEPATLEVWRDK